MLQIRKKNSEKGPLWLVEPKYSVGTDATCDIKVSGSMQSKHAELIVDGDLVTIVNLKKDANVRINGKAIEDRDQVHVGDIVSFGGEEYEILDPKSSVKQQIDTKKAPASGWSLKALNTGLADKQFPITGSHVLGRSKECDICLGVVHLSRQHAKISVTDKGLQVQDLNSSNGTYVNGKKIDAAFVYAGDELSFDTLRFRVFGPQAEEDKTMMRPTSNDNLTTIRPALTVPNSASPPKPKQAPTAATANSTRPKAKPQRPRADVATKPMAVAPGTTPVQGESNGSGKPLVILAAVAVVVGAGVAWFFLK